MPATIGTTDLCCLNLQQSLDNIAQDLAPDALMEGMGMVAALVSDVNTDGFEPVQTQFFEGKARPVSTENRPKIEVEYELPECNSVRTGAGARLGLCADQTERGNSRGYLTVTVEEEVATGGQFTKDDFDRLCESPNERLAKRIRKEARDLRRAINRTLIEIAYSLSGNYANGVPSIGATTKTVNLLNAAGHINPAGMAAIKSEFRRMHVDRMPIVVGGDILATWNDTRVMGGLGANAIGADPAAAPAGLNMYLDYHLDGVLQTLEGDAASRALAWVPGAFQLLEWYRYVGYNEEIGKEDYTETTMVIDGITYDWSLHYDKCDHVWKYEISKSFDLFAIPDAAYQPCWDFNHRLAFILACGDWDCASYFSPGGGE